jgi:para-nitrobenzyl esterase
MKNLLVLVFFIHQFIVAAFSQAKKTTIKSSQSSQARVKTVNGIVEGIREPSGIYAFKGIPFAAPPVGNLRWKEPQPVKNWQGIRKADQFGPRGMQPPIFNDMVFRSNGMSEDCLYLNVWTPSTSKSKLPVLVYFYGGGFVAGDGSEPRYEGHSMAQKGIVALTVNYRLGVFGLFSHPELTRESPHQSSGNYGLLDQSAALKWVQQNIAAFGGDPEKVTIAGESAGSISVSAQMASPLSKNLIAGAIGESGSLLGALPPVPLNEGEETGVQFAKSIGANSLAALRAMPADSLVTAATRFGPFRFAMTIDGYFFPKSPRAIFEAGEQAHVPLLVGWNSEEMNYRTILGSEKPTKENYEKAIKKLYGDRADDVLKVYSVKTDAEVEQAAGELAGDRFIAFSTWRWAELQTKTGGKPVYRYYYSHPRPASVDKTPAGKGAVHSAEIEYAMGNLASNKVFAWTQNDYEVSRIMQGYFVNFIKNGNPNGPTLPNWQATNTGNPVPVLFIAVDTRMMPDKYGDRYLLLEEIERSKTEKNQ